MAPPTTLDAIEGMAAPEAGAGTAVLGDDVLTLTDVTCTEGPAPDDTPQASLESSLTAVGDLGDGTTANVEITRFRSDTGAGDPVITETARIVVGEGGEARGVEAKRSTSGPDGAWLDLTDPAATEPLVDRRGDAVDVRATFGPEGARAGDEGLAEGRIRARCPA